MSKLILTKFKKSLAESSNIISQSRLLSSIHLDINIPMGLEATPEVERQYIDKSSFVNTYRQTHDHNKLIKKIPQLISENVELKQKISRMQQQLEILVQAQKKRSSFSFQQNKKQYDQNAQTSTHRLRRHKIEQISNQKDRRYSLEPYNYHQNKQSKTKQNVHSRIYKERTSKDFQEMQVMIEKIKNMQDEIIKLTQQNKILKQQNAKLNRIKQEKSSQIDTILTKFQQTLKNQQNLYKKQASLLQQKVSNLKTQIQTSQKQKTRALQQNSKLKKLNQSHILQQNVLDLIHQAKLSKEISINKVRQKGLYKINQTVSHLWSVKDAEFNNLLATLRFLEPKMQ